MKLAGISVHDIVEVNLRGRILLGLVTDVDDGVVYFQPVCPGAGWRHAKAREITAHWRQDRPPRRRAGGGRRGSG